MINRALKNYPFAPLFMLVSLATALVLAGCGGGGGGGGGTTGGNNGPPAIGTPGSSGNSLAAIAGKVVDNVGTGNPVAGALVSIVGSNATASTDSNGNFTVSNVPPAATLFTVTSPNIVTYPDLIAYLNLTYNTDPARLGGQCQLPLPALAATVKTALPANIQMFNNSAANSGSTTPPPPPSGCF